VVLIYGIAKVIESKNTDNGHTLMPSYGEKYRLVLFYLNFEIPNPFIIGRIELRVYANDYMIDPRAEIPITSQLEQAWDQVLHDWKVGEQFEKGFNEYIEEIRETIESHEKAKKQMKSDFSSMRHLFRDWRG
jgi:hypothetical protein